MADHAIARIRMLHAVAPDKPWLQYYATGTAHAPHHAPKDWIAKLAPGKHVVLVDFNYDGGVGKGATVTISVDEKPDAEGRVERTIAFRVSADETLDIGEDTGTPVSEDYKTPFRFTGALTAC